MWLKNSQMLKLPSDRSRGAVVGFSNLIPDVRSLHDPGRSQVHMLNRNEDNGKKNWFNSPQFPLTLIIVFFCFENVPLKF